MTRKTITTLLLCLATACLSLTATAQNYLQHRPNNFANDATELDDSATGMEKYLEWKRQREVQYAKEDQDEEAENQNLKRQLLETIANAEYIIEGKSIKGSSYNRNNVVVYSTIFEIQKVIKGNLKVGTCELLSADNTGYLPETRIYEEADSSGKCNIYKS